MGALFKELWTYAKTRKKFLLIPFIIVMMLIGMLLIASQGSVVAPFIYAIF